MARLSPEQIQRLPNSAFALPDSRRYPIHTKRYASDSIEIAHADFRSGKISLEAYDEVEDAAKRVLEK